MKNEESPKYKEFNDFYRKNPPLSIIDDTGIKHWNEIQIVNLNDYKPHPCKCGTTHLLDSDTWFHSAISLGTEWPKVIKLCKKCYDVLYLKRKDQTAS